MKARLDYIWQVLQQGVWFRSGQNGWLVKPKTLVYDAGIGLQMQQAAPLRENCDMENCVVMWRFGGSSVSSLLNNETFRQFLQGWVADPVERMAQLLPSNPSVKSLEPCRSLLLKYKWEKISTAHLWVGYPELEPNCPEFFDHIDKFNFDQCFVWQNNRHIGFLDFLKSTNQKDIANTPQVATAPDLVTADLTTKPTDVATPPDLVTPADPTTAPDLVTADPTTKPTDLVSEATPKQPKTLIYCDVLKFKIHTFPRFEAFVNGKTFNAILFDWSKSSKNDLNSKWENDLSEKPFTCPVHLLEKYMVALALATADFAKETSACVSSYEKSSLFFGPRLEKLGTEKGFLLDDQLFLGQPPWDQILNEDLLIQKK